MIGLYSFTPHCTTPNRGGAEAIGPLLQNQKELAQRGRPLRYRNLLVRQAVQMKNKFAVLRVGTGVSCNKQKLHKVAEKMIISMPGRWHG